MVSGLNINMGYGGSYMVLPLPKTKVENGVEFSVKSNIHEEILTTGQEMSSLMGNLDDIRRADANKDEIISLNELKACDNKSDFMQHLIFELEQFEKTWKASNR